MLVQNHVAYVREFLGQNTGFARQFLKRDVLILGEVKGSEEVKYIHGNRGEGTFTFTAATIPRTTSTAWATRRQTWISTATRPATG